MALGSLKHVHEVLAPTCVEPGGHAWQLAATSEPAGQLWPAGQAEQDVAPRVDAKVPIGHSPQTEVKPLPDTRMAP